MPKAEWHPANELLSDNAERLAMPWEALLAFEEADTGHGVRELLEAGLTVEQVAARCGVSRNAAKQAAFRMRNRRVTPTGV
jgi:hypothetical protein